MNNKYAMIIIGLTIFAFADVNKNSIDKFKELSRITNNVEKNIKRFEHLKTSNTSDVSKYYKFKRDSETFKNHIKRSLDMYQGNDFFTKEEFRKTARKVEKSLKTVKANLVSDYILFLTSEDVPNYAMMNVLFEVGILQENGIRIRTKQYLQGIPNDFKKFMFDKKDYINTLTVKERRYILPNFKLKLDPRFFKEFNLTKAPAIVLANCKGINPTIGNCKFKYLIRGDSSLTNFFDKIKEKDKSYENHYKYLIGNKIFKPGDE